MKLDDFSITLITSLEGDTGNNNKSILTFTTERGGTVVMPKFCWQDSDFPADINTIKEITLQIPSGILKIGNLSMPIEVEIYEDGKITFTGKNCHWDGNVAGLLGGMSGYGSHRIDPKNKGNVYEGTYLIPRRLVKGWGTHIVDLDRYQQRILTANVVRENRKKYDQARIAGSVPDEEWLEYIQKLDQAYVEGISADGIYHVLAYMLKDLVDLRPGRVRGTVSDQEWSEFTAKLQEAWDEQLKSWQG